MKAEECIKSLEKSIDELIHSIEEEKEGADQLKAIENAINELKSKKVKIPDSLRKQKLELVTSNSSKEEVIKKIDKSLAILKANKTRLNSMKYKLLWTPKFKKRNINKTKK